MQFFQSSGIEASRPARDPRAGVCCLTRNTPGLVVSRGTPRSAAASFGSRASQECDPDIWAMEGFLRLQGTRLRVSRMATRGVSVAEAKKDDRVKGILLTNTGLRCSQLGRTQEALVALRQALAIHVARQHIVGPRQDLIPADAIGSSCAVASFAASTSLGVWPRSAIEKRSWL